MGGKARGNNVTWIDPGSGFWTDAFRWSTSPDLPGPTDDVTIDVPDADILVTVKQDVQFINSLLSNDGLTIESGGLSVAADSTVNGAFTLSGGVLKGAGNFTLNGPSTWTNFTSMEGTGKTIVSATGTLTISPGTFTKTLARSIDNFGAMTFTGDNIFSSIAMRDATITNKEGATFTVDNASNAFFFGDLGTNVFLNNGTFIKSGTAAVTFGGVQSLPVSFVNAGQVNVQAGTVILQTGATHTGHFSISSGATLQFEGGHVFAAGSDVTGAGNLMFNSAGMNVSDGIFNVSGMVTFAGAVNTFNAPFTAGSLFVPNGGTLTFNNVTTLGSMSATNLLLAGSGDVSISGTSQWSGFGTMSGSGKTIITPGSTFSFAADGSPKNLQRTFVNHGTVNWGGTGVLATLNLAGAIFDNQADGIFNASGDQYSFFGVSGANAFNNAGIFNKSGTGTASFSGSGTSIVSLMNSGTLNVSAGLLQLDSAFANSGTVAVSGGTLTLGAGLMNTGAINLTGGVLNLGGTITTAQLGNWSNAGGQVNLLGILNNASFTLALTNATGNLRMLAGSQITGGALSTNGTSRLTIAGASTLDGLTLSGPVNIFQSSNLTVLNGLVLSGQPLTLDSAGGSLITFQGSQTISGAGVVTTAGGPGVATLGVSSGATLTVGAGITVHPGTRDMVLGSAGATVVNQGTFLADTAGSTLTVSGTSVQNLGTFQSQNGGTVFVNGALANLSGGTLSGGTWQIASGGTLRLLSGAITTNATLLVLDGAEANIYTGASGTNDALANLVQNAATGDLSILNGRTLSTAGNFLNNGKLTVGAGSGLTAPGLFTHNGTMTTSGTISTGQTIVDGSFTLAGGTHTVSADFVLGSAKSTAKYDLNSGMLAVGGFGTIGAGPTGAGVFNQSGGTFTIGKQLYISTAGTNTSTYNLSGGTLAAGEILVGFFGGSQGVFNQTGGAVTLTANPAFSSSGGLTLGFSSLPSTSGTYNLSSGTLTDQGAQIGFAGLGNFNQSGGTHTVNGSLNIGMFTGGTGTYAMSNGASLDVMLDEVVGTYASGVFNQTGGVNTVGGAIRIGPNSGSSGIFNLSGGTVNVALVDLMRGAFNATGGTLNATTFSQEGGDVTGTLIGQGTYSYTGGTFSGRLVNTGTVILNADFTAGNGLDNRSLFDVAANRTVTLNGAGFSGNGTTTLSGTLSASIEKIGDSMNATFTQSAGANNVAGDFYAGSGAGVSGTYTMQGGGLTVAGTSYIGFDGTGTFAQSSGTHTAAVLVLGVNAGGVGSYDLSDSASLSVAGSETIGLSGVGTFNQTGGTHSVVGTLALGVNSGATGTFNLSGGSLSAETIILARGAFNVTGGTFTYATFDQAGDVNITGDEIIGSDAPAVFNQTAGMHLTSGLVTLGMNPGSSGTYNLSGGTLSAGSINLMRGALNLTGGTLAYTSLVQTGGDISGTLTNSTSYTFNGGTFTGRLINSGTALINADLTIVNGLDNRGDFSVAGDHTVSLNGTDLNTDGTFALAGSLAGANINIGVNADGAFTQSSGTNAVTGNLNVGFAAGHAGAYTLQAGTLNVGGDTFVGLDGSGTFNQTGGTHSTSGVVTLGAHEGLSGIYNLSGGTFTADSINLIRGALNLTGGTLGYSTLTQTGGDISGTLTNATNYNYGGGTFSGRLINSGTVVLNADLTIGNGLDNRAEFTVAADRVVTLNGLGLTDDGTMGLAGSLSSASAKVGADADGVFTQTGGMHTIAGNLEVGIGVGHVGSYTLQAGTLNIGGDESIGVDGAGTFNQSDGLHTVAGTLALGVNSGGSGIFNLSGGTVTAGPINLIRGAFNDTGGTLAFTSFTQSGGDVIGTLSNATNYTLNAGTFSGRLVNSGTAVVNADVTFGNGLENHGDFSVAGGHAVSLNGMALTSDGVFSLAGSLNSAGIKLGVEADGTFTQSSGTNAVTGDLHVGFGAGHLGAYTLTDGTLNVSGNTYVGFDGGGTFNQALGDHTTNTLVVGANAGSSGTYTLAGGSLTANATTNNGVYTQTGGAASLGNVSGTGAMSVSGGTVAAKAIRQDSLSILDHGIVTLTSDSGASVVKTLSIPGGSGAAGSIDLGNNSLIVDYTGASAITDIRAAVIAGYAAGGVHWTGPGIRSSVAAADVSLGLGVVEAADVLHISGMQTAAFVGETVDATAVLIRLTRLGDTNLDGKVNFIDFQHLELGYGQPDATWRTGDFNYDGVVDRSDFALLYGNYGLTINGAPLAVSASELRGLDAFAAGVPEPASAMVIALGGAAAMLRRTRRRR
jgi:hypothetical protein